VSRPSVPSSSLSNRSSSRAGESPPRSTPSCCCPQRSSLLAQCSRTSRRCRGGRRLGSLLLSTFGRVVSCLNQIASRPGGGVGSTPLSVLMLTILEVRDDGVEGQRRFGSSRLESSGLALGGGCSRSRIWEFVFQGGSPSPGSLYGERNRIVKRAGAVRGSQGCDPRLSWRSDSRPGTRPAPDAQGGHTPLTPKSRLKSLTSTGRPDNVSDCRFVGEKQEQSK